MTNNWEKLVMMAQHAYYSEEAQPIDQNVEYYINHLLDKLWTLYDDL